MVGGDYAWHDIAPTATASPDAHTIQGYGEVGYGSAFGAAKLLPFVRFA